MKLDSDEAVYFLTIVMANRRDVFQNREHYVLLWRKMASLRERFGVDYDAWVLLPNHMHWLLRPRKADYSKVVTAFKRGIGLEWKERGWKSGGESIWQYRFWEHTIRDARDFRMHLDYIHMNPVKHGLVSRPADWPWSSVHRYVRLGWYEPGWTGRVELPGQVEYYWPE